MYKIQIWSVKQWQKDLSKIENKDQIKILNELKKLEREPWPDNLHVKKLKNYNVADFRLRVGRFRVLLDRDEDQKTVLVYRVLARDKLY